MGEAMPRAEQFFDENGNRITKDGRPWGNRSKAGGARKGAGGPTKASQGKSVDVQRELAKMSRGGLDHLKHLQEIAYDTLDSTPSQRIEALKTLLAYQFGKPVTPTQVDGKVDVTHHIGEGMSEEELLEMLGESEDDDSESAG